MIDGIVAVGKTLVGIVAVIVIAFLMIPVTIGARIMQGAWN